MAERRRYVRLEQAIPVAFERRGPTGTLKGEGKTKNVSAGGLCLLTQRPLGVGEKIALTLTLPKTADPISLNTRVKWVQPGPRGTHEVGVELIQEPTYDNNQYLLFICDLMYTQLEERKMTS